MASLRFDLRINRSADEVWKVVSDVGGIGSWFGGIESCEVNGDRRTIVLGGGITLEEEIVTNDDPLRRFQYRIVGGAVPVQFHLGTIDVLEDGQTARAIYSTEVQPDDLAALMGPAIESGLRGLKAHLEG
ncbi:MAG: SRPBCC family protein [Acidimicrobiales bacterium]